MGIAAALVRDGQVDAVAFAAAVRNGQPVGRCHCGGLLTGAIETVRGLRWILTRCRTCGQERAAPGGRVIPRPRHEPPAPDPGFLAAATELERRRLADHDP